MAIGDQYMEAARSLAPFNDRFLLTGAGFAKPWGGYLASEFWDQIIRDPAIREVPKVDDLLHCLTAFEDSLAEMEVTKRGEFSDADRACLRSVVRRAFDVHDQQLRENGTGAPGVLNRFVERFAKENRTAPLFTLNQDLMLERYYTGGNSPRVVVPCVHRHEWWLGGRSASAPWLNRLQPAEARTAVTFSADRYVKQIAARLCYIKLHGSLDWRLGDDEVLVLGGGKEESIARFPILEMSFAVFRAALASGGVHLLIIGYGFADNHVNDVIAHAVESSGLRVSVIDPTPSDALKRRLEAKGWPQIWRGISGYYTRPLMEVLREGSGEWSTLIRSFFGR